MDFLAEMDEFASEDVKHRRENLHGTEEKKGMVEMRESMGVCLASVHIAGIEDHESVEKETARQEEKCTSRKGRENSKTGSAATEERNELNSDSEFPSTVQKGNGFRRSYSRTELEALRYANIEEQQMKWNETYLALEPAVAQELDGISFSNQKKSQKKADRQQLLGKKKEVARVAEGIYPQKRTERFIQEVDPVELVDVGEGSSTFVEAYNGEDDSDFEHDNIQRPAFLVEGEPDFESGPPQDGLEYLRRVRWEAAQIPKVKVAKLDNSKLNREQTIYMPNIPDIAKCPEQLLPSKQWEDAFLAEFSELRQVLSRFESSTMGSFHGQPSPSVVNVGLTRIHGDLGDPEGRPTLSLILGMDAVTRASVLRRRIDTLDTASSLSRDECLWIFALTAAVDAPLDAEMSASLRSLLRNCASLRAGKSEADDEVMMLNMLVTISGKYFGQSEN